MGEERFSLLFYRICLLGCFTGLGASLYFLSAWAGYIGTSVPNVLLVGVLALAGLYFLHVFFVLLFDKSLLGSFLWSLILFILLAEVVLGLVPPTARDELTHHLAVPKLYASAGRIFEIPFDFPSYYPMLLDMLFTPWLKWQWDFIPKLIHGLFGFLTGLLVYCYLARRLSPLYGLLGFFFFVSTPAVLRLGNWAYVDLGLTFYSTASLLCLLRWVEARKITAFHASRFTPHDQWLLLAGLSVGFAAATKPNGLLVLLLLFFLVAGSAAKDQKAGIAKIVLSLALFLLMAFIPLSPWLAKNFAWTGNPFFPFFSSFFGASAAANGGGGGDPAFGILVKRHLLYGENGWEIAALPIRIFFSGQDDNPQYFDGVLNPMLILFLPWAFKGEWAEEKKILFGFGLFYFAFAFFLADLRIRYILPIVPPLVILLVYGIHNVYLKMAYPPLLFSVLILLSALNVAYLSAYFHKTSPRGYLLGEEDRDAYLTQRLPDYPAVRFINQSLPDSARIYFIFMGRRVYYCDRPYFHDGSESPWILFGAIQNAQNGDEIGIKLRAKGLTHLLVRDDLLDRFLTTNLSSQQQRVWRSFVTHHLPPLYRGQGYSVYQIHG
jgi:hypothetical protein